MNERLQFSWGHIIAFVALIAVSYITFMGYTYLTDGDFRYALIAMGITDVVFVLFFVGAQQLKASGWNPGLTIVWERILLFGTPLIFVAGMIGMSHFWTVKSRDAAIVTSFRSAIEGGRQMLDDYDTYANNRVALYEARLDSVIGRARKAPKSLQAVGLTKKHATMQRDNMVRVLRLQLLSSNTDSLRNVALSWIDGASEGASTWNAFLLGNKDEIRRAIAEWEGVLQQMSVPQMSNEALLGEVPQFRSAGAQRAATGVYGLTEAFTERGWPTVAAVAFGIVTYLMLLFPYLIQERHSKNMYTLWGRKIDETIETF